ncbi:hypothetical protein KI387_024305, partial [Taxus chinensis]
MAGSGETGGIGSTNAFGTNGTKLSEVRDSGVLAENGTNCTFSTLGHSGQKIPSTRFGRLAEIGTEGQFGLGTFGMKCSEVRDLTGKSAEIGT